MADTNPNARPVSFADDDARQEYFERKAKRRYRSDVRKYRREAEADHAELNLTAMMDMMTILLVFLLKSYGASGINVSMNNDLMPPTSTSTLMALPAVTVTITRKDIAVGERGVVQLADDGQSIPPQYMKGLVIAPVKSALDGEVKKLNNIAKYNPAMRAKEGTDKDPTKMLIIVGDKRMPYKILFSVLGTAGLSGLKYFKFLTLSSNS